MNLLNRRERLPQAGILLAGSPMPGRPQVAIAAAPGWIGTCRGLTCEAYDPLFDDQAGKGVHIARQVICSGSGLEAVPTE
jgi:hypothetical protein